MIVINTNLLLGYEGCLKKTVLNVKRGNKLDPVESYFLREPVFTVYAVHIICLIFDFFYESYET